MFRLLFIKTQRKKKGYIFYEKNIFSCQTTFEKINHPNFIIKVVHSNYSMKNLTILLIRCFRVNNFQVQFINRNFG